MSNGPLAGIRVLDFSTLLPGPFATLMLAEAGADVIKVERPPHGDEMRRSAAEFTMLNAGKRSIFIDLKDQADRERLMPLLRSADIVVEQFRPGVMARLGLDAATLRTAHPKLIYCSINGYGSVGPNALRAGHDLTYAAESGMLMQVTAADGAPVMPHVMLGDIGGGSYPAVMNILMALLRRDRTGDGATIEIAIADNIQPFLYPAHASAFGQGIWPQPNGAIETGAYPRYALYRAADDRWIAAAPVEQKFWRAFCTAIDLPESLVNSEDHAEVGRAVAERIAAKPACEWLTRFAAEDTACALVMTFEEAMAARGSNVTNTGAAPLPLAAAFRTSERAAPPLAMNTGDINWR